MHAQQNQKSSLRTYITLLEIVKKNLNHTVRQSMRHVVALLLHKNSLVPYKTFTKFLLSLLFCGYKVSQTLHKGSGSNFSSNLSPNIFFAHSPPFFVFFCGDKFPVQSDTTSNLHYREENNVESCGNTGHAHKARVSQVKSFSQTKNE